MIVKVCQSCNKESEPHVHLPDNLMVALTFTSQWTTLSQKVYDDEHCHCHDDIADVGLPHLKSCRFYLPPAAAGEGRT